MTARVSVLIANRDYGAYLGDCLESVLGQDEVRPEIIVVDDGSKDDSRRILESYGDRIRVIHEDGIGQGGALNRAFVASHGEIICLLDSDDVWHPGKLLRVLDTFDRHPDVGWLRHKLTLTDEKLRPLDAELPRFRGTRLIDSDREAHRERVVGASTSALAFRRDLAERIFPVPVAEFRMDADAYLLSMIGETGSRGISLDERLGMYRRHRRQLYAVKRDPRSIVAHQAAVDRRLARLLGYDTPAELPVSVHKHEAVLAALDGDPLWGVARRGAALRGGKRLLRLARTSPGLALRQAGALGLALAAPRAWLRRLARAHAEEVWVE